MLIRYERDHDPRGLPVKASLGVLRDLAKEKRTTVRQIIGVLRSGEVVIGKRYRYCWWT